MKTLQSGVFQAIESQSLKHRYEINVENDVRRQLARGWLTLGVVSLLLSGFFSVLLVLARTPGIQNFLPRIDFFRVALVVHVDLSVLVWFISVAGLIWSVNCSVRALSLGKFALYFCMVGTALITLAPFLARGEPLMANYIPVLNDSMFMLGILVIGTGFSILIFRNLLFAPKLSLSMTGTHALQFGIYLSVVSAAVAVVAFFLSWLLTPGYLVGKPYYEILFWGGGHTLQFVWTLLMLVGWLWLANGVQASVTLSSRFSVVMFVLTFSGVLVTPAAYFLYDVASVEHRNLLTWGMQIGGGIAALPMCSAVLLALWRAPAAIPAQKPMRSALIASVLLFCIGGLIGIFINGNNVKIPAHYHGSIVGVTLAFMGMVYYLLPRLGYSAPADQVAAMQPYVYGGGQLMHIVGLVWSGGYGVQRKVAGSEQVLKSTGEIAGMGLMGLGGLIAIIGGLLFVITVIRSIRRRPLNPSDSIHSQSGSLHA